MHAAAVALSTAAVRAFNRSLLPSMASGKLNTPQFKRLITPDLQRLKGLLTAEGYSLRLVGGVVRDLLLAAEPKDIDLATDCVPQEVIEILQRAGIKHIPTGLQHGTVTAHMGSADYEITTLRLDRDTDGRHAVVEFTTDWRADAQRRDLTINAMSLSLNGDLYDYFDGQSHLAQQKVLFVGDAQKRIREDYLRILRYFRFYGRIVAEPGLHNHDTLEAIRETAAGLEGISVERVWMEMRQILVGNHAPHLVELMHDLGVAQHIGLPANTNQSEMTEVWKRMRSRDYVLHPVSLLVALVHSTEAAIQLALDWKLSKAERLLAGFVASHRQQTFNEHTTVKAFQDWLVDKTPPDHVWEVLLYCGREDIVSELREWPVPQFPLTGCDVQAVGIPPGPNMGRLLKLAREKWKDSYFLMTRDELAQYVVSVVRNNN